MKHTIHIHQAKMRKGEPCIIDRTWRGSKHYSKVEILGPSTVVWSQEPDRCGARAWIITESEVIGS